MLWISGPPRSGTTMLNVMLSGDGYLPECSIITEFVKLYHTCKYDNDQRYKTFLGENNQLKENFSAILNISLKETPKYAVLKDPNLCLYLDDWRELFPDDRMVMIVRDPRDVVGSMLQVLRRTKPRASVRKAMRAVAPHLLAIGRASQTDDKLLIVRYEDVVAQKHETISLLSKFTGIDLAQRRESAYQFDNANPFYSELYGKRVTDERVGAYAAQLSTAEECAVLYRFSDFLDRYFPDAQLSGWRVPFVFSLMKRWRRARGIG